MKSAGLTILFVAVLFSSCSRIEIQDVSVTIQPYFKSDRGKFWEICFDMQSHGLVSEPIAYFEIYAKDGRVKEYDIDFIHLDEGCNRKNVLVSFLPSRRTPIDESDWLTNLDGEDIDSLVVRVRSNGQYIFRKALKSNDLK